MKKSFSTVEQAIAAIARGEIVIVLDAEDREDEGDFVCAAELATPDVINRMLQGRGQLCVSILSETAERCRLNPVVSHNNAPLTTAFLTPVDHTSSKTGITAGERSTTIRALADAGSTESNFVRPGHVFPLLAKQGGVLQRAGHTEASMDLARLAGCTPSGVLCEILDSDGERPAREYLFRLAEELNLHIIHIEQIVAYRQQREQIVHRAAQANVPTKYGDVSVIAYDVDHDAQQPVALIVGDVTNTSAPLVRLHSSCFTGDLIESLRCDCGDQLSLALEMISHEGAGVVVYLPQEGRGIGLVNKLRAYRAQDECGLDTVEANLALGFQADERDYGTGLQVVRDLGIERLRLLTNNPSKTEAIKSSGMNVEVVEQVPLLPMTNCHNRSYLQTKKEKMGHLLPSLDFTAAVAVSPA